MSILLEYYSKIYTRIKRMNEELLYLGCSLEEEEKKYSGFIVNVNSEMRAGLSDNANYTAKVNAFIAIARTHTTQLKAPQGPIEYDNGKLSRIAVQINCDLQNDSFATQLYTEASGQLLYLVRIESLIKKNAKEQIKVLENEFKRKKESILSDKKRVETEIVTYLYGKEFLKFIEMLTENRTIFCSSTGSVSLNDKWRETLSLGTLKLDLPLPSSIASVVAERTKGFYNELEKKIRVPANISIKNGSVIIADYENSSETTVLAGIQNFIINIARYYGKEYTRVCFIDPIRFNSSSLGCLSRLCGDKGSFIDVVPSSIEDVKKKLKALINEINICEVRNNSFANQKKRKALYVFHNFPKAYDPSLVTQIQQLCVNAEHYNITVILTNNKSSKNTIYSDTLVFLRTVATNIDTKLFFDPISNIGAPFEWYTAPKMLPADIEKHFIEEKPAVDFSNDYEKRIGFSTTRSYKKGIRKLENIPFGIDENGTLQKLYFENSNFATFICGASRSGKSTLLHTLISGMIQNNHPDDLELWLVDFKMTEFSRYINRLPPHIRYIILDESPELVYDIVDRLTEILLKRQNIFKGKWQKLDDVPPEKYMPAIMVIIDEFSVMSQIIGDSIISGKENYVVKLQMLLAKGAALGLHFIFASQGFTSGTRGLNDFSKKQVQQRIAMKTEYSEIKDTLDLKSASDEDKILMEQLPVYHVITRIPADERGNHLKLSHVLHISDYMLQEDMIDSIISSMQPVLKYDVNNISGYISKRPMIIDGNVYGAFYAKKDEMSQYLESNREMLQDGDEFALFIGEPRRMISIHSICLTNEFCQNILIVASSGEKMPAASIILSVAESLAMQSKSIEVWSTRKNPIYRQIKVDCHKSYNSRTNLESICEQIKIIKDAIQKKLNASRFFVLLGFETLMADMSYQSTSQPEKSSASTIQTTYEKRGEEESDLNSLLMAFSNGKEITKSVKTGSSIENESKTNDDRLIAYDAREDLKYILTNGPRLGYHFIMQFGTVGDISQSKLDISLFKHKILFETAKNDAAMIIGAANAAVVENLRNHSFRYSNGLESLSYRPYLHPGLSWDGWRLTESGVVNLVEEEEDYLL